MCEHKCAFWFPAFCWHARLRSQLTGNYNTSCCWLLTQLHGTLRHDTNATCQTATLVVWRGMTSTLGVDERYWEGLGLRETLGSWETPMLQVAGARGGEVDTRAVVIAQQCRHLGKVNRAWGPTMWVGCLQQLLVRYAYALLPATAKQHRHECQQLCLTGLHMSDRQNIHGQVNSLS